MKETIARVEKYLFEFARFLNDKEHIHTLHAGCDREAVLNASDVKALLDYAKGMQAEHDGPLIPEGWKLVPIDPTPAMLAEIHIDPAFTARALMTRYEAMLSVVPEPPERKRLVEPEEKPALPDVEIVKELRKLAANSQSVLFSHRQVLKEAACLIELSKDTIFKMMGERFAEIKRAVDALVYQEIRYVSVSAWPVSSRMSDGIIKEAEAVLNQRRKHLNTLLTP